MIFSDPKFIWDEKNKTAQCNIEIKNIDYPVTITGIATCCPEDYDMSNEKTGCDIAYQRAIINLYKYYKAHEIKPRLKALNQLYYSMEHSKHFNPKSYENKMLQRQIHQLENELNIANDLLIERKEELKEYLDKKENFYQKIRSFRRVQEEERKHQDEN